MADNTGVLIYCETTGGQLTSLTTELLGAGNRLARVSGLETAAVIIGSGISGLAPEAIAYGADKVYVVDEALLKMYAAETCLKALENVVKQFRPAIILMGHTAVGKDLAPWLAFRLNSAATMDCLSLEMDSTNQRLLMTRPVYGGNAQAVQICLTDPQIATVRNKALAPAVRESSRQGQVINTAADCDAAGVKVVVLERKIESGAGIKLEDARVVVAGGRGIGSAEGFKQLSEVAALLKGAVGATRPPCDNRWIGDNQQIGITGKVVSPDLYIAIGLSGASQHLSGCSNAKVIVAINKDPEANVFKVARYGIVADWKAVLAAIKDRLTEL